jgi:ankyrin repeat protein
LLTKEIGGQTAWHYASKRGNINILEKLWERAIKKLTPEGLNNELLLGKDIRGKTAWHVAAEEGKPQALQKLWEWAKRVLTPQELKYDLLLATVEYPNSGFWSDESSTKLTALQKAAQQGKTGISENMAMDKRGTNNRGDKK